MCAHPLGVCVCAQPLPVTHSAAAASGKGGHKVEVRGVVPPWVLYRLCRALRDAHDSDFQVSTLCHSRRHASNLQAGIAPGGGGQRCGQWDVSLLLCAEHSYNLHVPSRSRYPHIPVFVIRPSMRSNQLHAQPVQISCTPFACSVSNGICAMARMLYDAKASSECPPWGL